MDTKARNVYIVVAIMAAGVFVGMRVAQRADRSETSTLTVAPTPAPSTTIDKWGPKPVSLVSSVPKSGLAKTPKTPELKYVTRADVEITSHGFQTEKLRAVIAFFDTNGNKVGQGYADATVPAGATVTARGMGWTTAMATRAHAIDTIRLSLPPEVQAALRSTTTKPDATAAMAAQKFMPAATTWARWAVRYEAVPPYLEKQAAELGASLCLAYASGAIDQRRVATSLDLASVDYANTAADHLLVACGLI